MLSATHTLEDVKKELEAYTFYEYDDNTDFEAAITYASEESARFIKNIITPGYYTTIAAKNKTGLDFYIEEPIYLAEIYQICGDFLSIQDRLETQKRKASHESLGENGITRSTYGATGKALAADEYYRKAKQKLSDAGYDMTIRLGRNIFSKDYRVEIR